METLLLYSHHKQVILKKMDWFNCTRLGDILDNCIAYNIYTFLSHIWHLRSLFHSKIEVNTLIHRIIYTQQIWGFKLKQPGFSLTQRMKFLLETVKIIWVRISLIFVHIFGCHTVLISYLNCAEAPMQYVPHYILLPYLSIVPSNKYNFVMLSLKIYM